MEGEPMEVKCSCVVLNYNDYKTTEKLVKIIEHYDSIEGICVVDNHSQDDSFEILSKLRGGKIKVIQTEKNGGYGYGNNTGIKYVDTHFCSKYILIMNPDVIVDEILIKKMISTMNSDDRIATCTGVPLNAEGKNVENPGWNILPSLQYLLSINHILHKLFIHNRVDLGRCDCVQGSLLMVNKDSMISVGMYDETFFLFCEEDVLGHKFKEKGLYSLVLDDTYIHAHSVSIKRNINSVFKRQGILMNSFIKVLKKYYNYSDIKLLILSPYILASYLINSIVVIIKELFTN